jgi:hypothetical protein
MQYVIQPILMMTHYIVTIVAMHYNMHAWTHVH